MRSLVPILLLVWVAVGCGVDVKPDVQAMDLTPKIEFKEPPEYAPATRFGLIRNGAKLQVGDNSEKGLTIFERPEKSSAISDLPEGWPKDYRSRGWQSEKESFGMILRRNEVVGALITQEDVTERRVLEVFEDYRRFLGEPDQQPQTQNVRFWLWETAPYRCVICATKNAKAQLVVTVGVGYTEVMDALGMNQAGALADSQKAEKTLSEK
jgi:hypothetical protein